MTTTKFQRFKKAWLSPKRSPIIDVIQFLVLVAVGIGLLGMSTERLGYNWQWYRVPRYLFRFEDDSFVAGLLLEGLKVTLHISAVGLILAFAFGLVTALFRLSNSFVARILARGYLELVRNSPLLVLLFLIYFVLGPILGISRFASALLALSLFEGAYASEIFRAGIVSIHKGQLEAAHSLGLNTVDTYRYVVLPQAFRMILPPLTSQAISLVKDSALVSTVAIYDLTMRGQEIIANTFLTFEIWFAVAAIYLAITVTLSTIVSIMERRLRVVT